MEKTTKTKGFCRFRNPLGISKKGVIEIQFNWILILIAGAIILIFFISIINKQRVLSESKTAAIVTTNLQSILTGAEVSTGTVNIVSVPKIDIGFECNRFFIGQAHKEPRSSIIFAPNLLKGKEIITWALDWSLPYRITNFLYVTDPQLRYIIVNNSKNLGKKLYDELPKELNKELINEDEQSIINLKDKSNYKVKFIFLGNVDNRVLIRLIKMKEEDVTAINLSDLKDSDVILPTGRITFLKRKGVDWVKENETVYLKKESLFGAIFAADAEMYNCVMGKAFKKLNLITQIYLDRSTKLSEDYGLDNFNCANAHIKALQPLRNIRDASEQRINDFPATLENMEAMMDYSGDIGGTEGSANNLAQLFSCALIY